MARAEAPGSTVEYRSGLPADASPRGVAPGADGDVWFPDVELHTIGRVTPGGQIEELPLPSGEGAATDLALGADGEIWASLIPNGQELGEIDRIGPGGEVEAFPLPEGQATDAFSITRGPGEDLWFTLAGESESESRFGIGRIVAAGPKKGEIKEFRSGFRADSYPSQITLGPDGNLWFIALGTGEHPATPAIGRITPSGEVHEYTSLPSGSEPDMITTGPDGDVWFTDDGTTPAIGRITPGGEIKEFSTGLPSGSEPAGIATGADGNLWFADNLNGQVGRVTPSGTIAEFPDTLGEHFFSGKLSGGPDGRMWLTDHGLQPGVMAITTGPPAGATEAQIEGHGALGERLTCSGASWPEMNGAEPSLSAFPFDGYSWLLNGVPIAGANGARYTPSAEQGGQQITCRVAATYPTPVLSEVSESQPLALAGGPPTATGALTIAPTPVYSTVNVECAGAKWSTPEVETQWLIDGAPVTGANSRTFQVPRNSDGHQLSCRQIATANGQQRTLTSASQTVYELPPRPSWAGTPDYENCTPSVCIEKYPFIGVTYGHADAWYVATPIACRSAPWTSAAGDSVLPEIRNLAEAHTVRVTLERVSGATTVTLASEQLTDLGDSRNENTGEHPAEQSLISLAYGSQDFIGSENGLGDVPGYAGTPDFFVAGQGEVYYYTQNTGDAARSFVLTYNLTAADLGAHLRCVVTAEDGPIATPTVGSASAEATVSTSSACAPVLLAPGDVPQPYFGAVVGNEDCVAEAAGKKLPPIAEALKTPVIAGVADIALGCSLPGGCNGNVELVDGASAAAASKHAKRPLVLARSTIELRRGGHRVLKLKLTGRARKLLARNAKSGLAAVLQLTHDRRTRKLTSIRLTKGAKR